MSRFEDGKVAETWTQWDTLRFMKNLGAIPEDAVVPAGSSSAIPTSSSGFSASPARRRRYQLRRCRRALSGWYCVCLELGPCACGRNGAANSLRCPDSSWPEHSPPVGGSSQSQACPKPQPKSSFSVF